MKNRSFNRASVVLPCLVLVILILTAMIPAYAADHLSGTAQGVLQQQASGQAQGQGQRNQKPDKVTLCHATGSATNPYVEITVSANAATNGHGHANHTDDIIPAPPGGCPKVLWPGGVAPIQRVSDQGNAVSDKITICHATGSATHPYVEITVSVNAATDGHGHANHTDDIIPAPPGGCPNVVWPGGVAPAQAQATVSATSSAAPVQGQATVTVTPSAFTPVTVTSAVCVDWLVYSTNVTGNWNIFRLGGLANNPNADPNLTKGVGQNVSDITPSLSPDRRWIAFSSNRDGNWEIYIASTDGIVQQRMTHTTAQNSDPVWSPNGQLIAFESNRDGNWALYTVDVTTGGESRLTYDSGSYVNASWSPDGTHLLFQSDRNGGVWQIYELNIATLDFRLISDGHGDDLDPSYSFDGTRIVFRSLRDKNSVIYMMNGDGTGVTRISDPAGRAVNPIWSPDNTLIAYQSNLGGHMHIYVYEVASGKTRQVTDSPVDDYAPTWLCHSPTLVFTSDVDGNPNLFSVPALPVTAAPMVVQTQATRLTTESAADRDPVNTPGWSHASLLSPLLQLIGNR